VKDSEIRAELWEIAKSYPTLQGVLQKELQSQSKYSSGERSTVGRHWVTLLKDLEPSHFQDVCYEYATLAKPLPNPIDQLVFEIRQECLDRKAAEQAKLEQYEKYHRNNKVMQWVRSDSTGAIAVELGEMVRRGHLTKEENDKRMDELLAWDKQHAGEEQTQPSWLAAMAGAK